MKAIVVLVLLSVAASSVNCQGVESVFLAIETYLQNVGLKYREECIKTSMVDVAFVEALEQKAQMTDDKKLKCYLECQYLKTDIIDSKGIINSMSVKNVLQARNQAFVDEVEKQCKHPKSADVCEAAYEGTICVFKILLEEQHFH